MKLQSSYMLATFTYSAEKPISRSKVSRGTIRKMGHVLLQRPISFVKLPRYPAFCADVITTSRFWSMRFMIFALIVAMRTDGCSLRLSLNSHSALTFLTFHRAWQPCSHP